MAESSVKQPWPKMKGSDPEEDRKAASVWGTCFGYNVGEGIGLKGTDPSPPSHCLSGLCSSKKGSWKSGVIDPERAVFLKMLMGLSQPELLIYFELEPL